MIKRFGNGLFMLLVCSVLISCAAPKITYRYGNVSYEQPEPALAAQKADIDSLVSRIPPTDHPVGGSAIVIVPSVSMAMKTLVQWKGPEAGQEQQEKAIRYHATTLVNGYKGKGEIIQKRRIFDRVVITESDSPENAAFSEDTAIVLVTKNGKLTWVVKNGKTKPPVQTEIEVITTALPPVQREILWLDKVEKASR
jgi:hypothetical protein